MGRRKIEIKAIKDDRNRSVTFLKRKGGLFKKAHELSVLCSVDVAVIIFGNNKKLYEYSSSDIGEILQRYNFYGGPNEHKGPADFNGKKDLDDDDDDDIGSPSMSHHSQEAQMMPPQFQNQPAFQHIRHHTPSASPPIPNGVPFHHIQRQHTPQPQMGSRPPSRNAPRRISSNLAQQHMAQSQPPQQVNGYGYMPQPSMYNPQNGPIMSHPQPGHQQPPSFQYPGPPPPQHQLQQVYMEDQRRSSMPPTFPKQERPGSVGPMATPPQPQSQQLPQQLHQQHQQHQHQQHQLQQHHQPPQGQQQHDQHQQIPPQAQMLEPVKRMSVKSRSIFTPIDESRSILSQHWQSSTSAAEIAGSEPGTTNRSLSLDAGNVGRGNGVGPSPPPPPRAQQHIKNRNTSISSIDTFTPPSRTNSGQLGAKRPRLKVQIPDEPSDGGGSATGDSGSAHDTDATGSHPSRQTGGTEGSHSSGVVLPPPSPSASALLSAGASGPPNPFARPHPPTQQTTQSSSSNTNNSNNIDTPVSALPSRFMNNDFLPSPSSFYPEWNFRGSDSNTLPSPLNFATPVLGSGPSFIREDSGGAATAVPSTVTGVGKRKTPEMDETGGDAKRAKHEG